MATTLKLPFAISASGSLATLAQDSTQEVAQSIEVLLSTPRGERAAIPDYGLLDPIGEQAVDEAEIAQAISDWDDRVSSVEIETIAQTLATGERHDIVNIALQVIGAS